jgi:hypothetical protein
MGMPAIKNTFQNEKFENILNKVAIINSPNSEEVRILPGEH